MGSRSVTSTPPGGIWPPPAAPADADVPAAPASAVPQGPDGGQDGIESPTPAIAALAVPAVTGSPLPGGLSTSVAAEARVGTRAFETDDSPALAARVAQLMSTLGSST